MPIPVILVKIVHQLALLVKVQLIAQFANLACILSTINANHHVRISITQTRPRDHLIIFAEHVLPGAIFAILPHFVLLALVVIICKVHFQAQFKFV